MSEHLNQIEKSADRIRGELAGTLRELNRRRHLAMNPRYQIQQQLRKHFVAYATAAGITAAVALGSLVYARRAYQQKNVRLSRARFEAVERAWRKPGRVATKSRHKPIGGEIASKLLVALVVAVGGQLLRKHAKKWVA